MLLIAMAGGALGLDNGFTKPPMGWSALYGAPFGSVDENITRAAASGLASGGLLASGYEYVVLDDWYADRDAAGKIRGIPAKWPSGLPAVSTYIHSLGVKFGVYSAASQRTCGNYSASQFREVEDAAVFAHEWQIDYLKYDSCIYNNGVAARARYLTMSRALNATGRQIFYSVEGWSGAEAATQGDWGPQLANMWRTGSDIWPDWDLCILNNLYQANNVAQFMVPGRAWNDPDMLQPPATIPGTTRKPGLTFEESRAQFVLWASMKTPLMLGIHYDQLATLATDFPAYYQLVTNEEIIAIDQDPSRAAVLVAAMPSAAQQAPGSAAAPLAITTQPCGAPTRVDQQWVPGATKGTIQAKGTALCLDASNAVHPGGAVAVPCATATAFGLAHDSQFHTAPLLGGGSASPPHCLHANGGSGAADILTVKACESDGLFPPAFGDNSVSAQTFVWDTMTGNIVLGASGQCVTLGLDNMPAAPPKPYTNNGTLQHEVWAGPMSTGKQVLVLFNKGADAAAISAAPSLFKQPAAGATLPVRDVLAKKNLAPLAAGAPLTATVASHGVQLFMLG